MEYNGKYMMKNNYEGSKNLFHYCQDRRIPFIYASSASTYGNGTNLSLIHILGLPLLAMHSARELMGAADQEQLNRLMNHFLGGK